MYLIGCLVCPGRGLWKREGNCEPVAPALQEEVDDRKHFHWAFSAPRAVPGLLHVWAHSFPLTRSASEVTIIIRVLNMRTQRDTENNLPSQQGPLALPSPLPPPAQFAFSVCGEETPA